MALNAITLGAALKSAAGSADAAGNAAWNAIAAALVLWVQAAQVTATGGTPLTAAGPAIAGTGAIVPSGVPALAVAAGSTDAAGLVAWTAIASALSAWLATGGVNPSGLVAYTGAGTGPVTGTATLAFTGAATLAVAAGSTDAPGMMAWVAIASAIRTHLETTAVMTPTMTNPGVGGAVAGTGVIS